MLASPCSQRLCHGVSLLSHSSRYADVPTHIGTCFALLYILLLKIFFLFLFIRGVGGGMKVRHLFQSEFQDVCQAFKFS